MITSAIIERLVLRISPEAELGLILFSFLFPAIWGAVLAITAIFGDLKAALNKKKAAAK